MGIWMIVPLLVVLLVALLVLLLAVQLIRRLRQLRRGGVDVSMRMLPPAAGAPALAPAQPPTGPARAGPGSSRGGAPGWQAGIGRYRGDQFHWFRLAGVRSGPQVVLDRTAVEIVDRRRGAPGELDEALAQLSGGTATVLRLRAPEGTAVWEMAMAPGVLTGFSSWLESIPPGGRTGYRQVGRDPAARPLPARPRDQRHRDR